MRKEVKPRADYGVLHRAKAHRMLLRQMSASAYSQPVVTHHPEETVNNHCIAYQHNILYVC